MDKKPLSKFAALQGLPSGLARQFVSGSRPDGQRQKAVASPAKAVAASLLKTLPATLTTAGAIAEGRRQSGVPQDGPPLTKAQKVKAWRKANPEAYAEQKRRNAEKQAKKRAGVADG